MLTEGTLRLIAFGAVQASLDAERSGFWSGELPPQLSLGVNRLALALLLNGDEPPQSMPEVLRWLHTPLNAWPIEFEEPAMREGVLFENGKPTSWCTDWFDEDARTEAEWLQGKLIKDVLEGCRTENNPSAYAAFRRLLIERPVLTLFEFHQARGETSMRSAAQWLAQAYENAPKSCVANGACIACGNCAHLLHRTSNGGWVCENARCLHIAGVNGPRHGRRYQVDTETPMTLSWGLRRFVNLPGQAELRLERRLKDLGLEVEMWPEFDAYDLRVQFPNGETWACDVKDWQNPGLLARHLVDKGPTFHSRAANCRCAFWVFPDEHRHARYSYMQTIKNALKPRKDLSHIKPCFESDFIKSVRMQQKKLMRSLEVNDA